MEKTQLNMDMLTYLNQRFEVLDEIKNDIREIKVSVSDHGFELREIDTRLVSLENMIFPQGREHPDRFELTKQEIRSQFDRQFNKLVKLGLVAMTSGSAIWIKESRDFLVSLFQILL